MQNFVTKITEWMLEKEEELAKKCAIPMSELDKQLEKVRAEKVKVQEKYDESMALLNEVEEKLEKMKSTETLRCQNK